MNKYILEDAAIYVNAYRSRCERQGYVLDKATLRSRVASMFGDIYAAILVN